MENLLISACLLGIPCRYDGRSVKAVDVSALREKYNLIPVCPEIYGGLPTPRIPSERQGEKTMMKDGADVTENYLRGAKAAYDLCLELGCKKALLKEKSELEILKDKLQTAIAEENYEEAAKLRDEIRSKEGK